MPSLAYAKKSLPGVFDIGVFTWKTTPRRFSKAGLARPHSPPGAARRQLISVFFGGSGGRGAIGTPSATRALTSEAEASP